ncbi:MAG TPA: glycosyltransferase family 39 protein [Actinomycetota bacterium]|nr:glycosyltransferase family 39 protein [Actinomycetota bacterium]
MKVPHRAVEIYGRLTEGRLAIVWVVALALAGIALRVWVLGTQLGALDSDEAVGALMARHVLDGEFPIFYWGQSYGGAQEAYITALAFAVFGSSVIVHKLVAIVLTVVAAGLTWRVGKRTIGDRAGALGALLFWVWPATVILRSTKGYAFYSFGLICCLLVVLLVLRLAENAEFTDLVWLGVAAGMGWWATMQTVLVIAPACVWLVVRRPEILKKAFVPAVFFVLGSLPWIAYNIQNDWISLSVEVPPMPNNTYFDHIVGYFRNALPTALGLRVIGNQDWVLFGGVVGWVLYLALVVGLVWLVLRRPERTAPLIAVVATYPFILAFSPLSWYVINPRYLFFMIPLMALLLAWAMVRYRAEIPGVALCVALTVAGIWPHAQPAYGPWTEDYVPPWHLGTLVDDLEERGITRVFANYWTSYRITFESEERVIAVAIGHQRYEPHATLVRSSGSPGYVIVAGSLTDARFRGILDTGDISYERFETSNYAVYDLHEPLMPEHLPPDLWLPPEG